MELTSCIVFSLETNSSLAFNGRLLLLPLLSLRFLVLLLWRLFRRDVNNIVTSCAACICLLFNLLDHLTLNLVWVRCLVARTSSSLTYRFRLYLYYLRLFLQLKYHFLALLSAFIGCISDLYHALLGELCPELIHNFLWEKFAHLHFVLYGLLCSAQLHARLHLQCYEFAGSVHQLPLTEGQFWVLWLGLQLQGLVVQIVDSFSISLNYLWIFTLGGGGRLRENVVLCVDKDVECREDVLLINNSLDSFTTALGHLSTVNEGKIFFLASLGLVGIWLGHVAFEKRVENVFNNALF